MAEWAKSVMDRVIALFEDVSKSKSKSIIRVRISQFIIVIYNCKF